jgi:hypothetical protein
MAAATYQYGTVMSRERFLKTAQRKKSMNKKKGEPSMRIEALLESTLIRIRLERQKERDKDFYIEEEEDEEEEEEIGDDYHGCSSNKKIKLDNYDIDNFDFNGNENENSFLGSCFESCTMISSRELSSKSQLWDDPEQVEDYLKKVSTHTTNSENSSSTKDCVNNNNNINSLDIFTPANETEGSSSCTPIDFDDSFLDSIDDVSPDLSSFVPNYDVSSFTIEFDNLYKELVQNLTACA